MISLITGSLAFWNLPGTPWLLLTYGLGLAIYGGYKKYTKYNSYDNLLIIERK